MYMDLRVHMYFFMHAFLHGANTLKNQDNWTVITRMYNLSVQAAFYCLSYFISQPVGFLSKLPSFRHILPFTVFFFATIRRQLADEGWRQCTKVTCDLCWCFRKPAFTCWFSWKWFSFPFYHGDISNRIVALLFKELPVSFCCFQGYTNALDDMIIQQVYMHYIEGFKQVCLPKAGLL